VRAFTNRSYGGVEVLRLETLERPKPRRGEVRVRVHATGVTGGDPHLLRGDMLAVRLFWGVLKPRKPILGFVVSGTVEAVGQGVDEFAVGEPVFGVTMAGGGYAEACCVPAKMLLTKPKELSHVEAACLPVSATTSLQALRLSPLWHEPSLEAAVAGRHGEPSSGSDPATGRPTALINGASGGTGSYAIQLAKLMGWHVTGVAGAGKQEALHELGADRAIDYTQEDFVTDAARYDVFVDFVGSRTIAECRRVLSPDGLYIAMAGKVSRTLFGSLFGGRQVKGYIAKDTREDLQLLTDLALSGALTIPLTKTYAFEETPEALGVIAAGHTRGKLVVLGTA